MKYSISTLLVAINLMLVACGGGSGGSSNSSSAVSTSSLPASSSFSDVSASAESSSSSSETLSSSSSSWSPQGCSFENGDVFVDQTCSGISEPSSYEYKKADNSGGEEQPLGTAGQLITQQILDTQEPDHHQVLDVVYSGSTEYNGGVHFFMPTFTDMTAYISGKLQFDVRVLAAGETAAPVAYKVACGWPCEATETRIEPKQMNQWQTVEVSASDLNLRGLNLGNVNVAVEFQAPWDQQAGVHFQVDNIRWVKDSQTTVYHKCYAEHFADFYSPLISIFGLSDAENLGTVTGWIADVIPHLEIRPDWTQVNGDFVVAERTDGQSATCFKNATFSADVYIPKAYIEDGNLTLGLVYGEQNNWTSFNEISVADLKGDNWNHISVNLGDSPAINSNTNFGIFLNPHGKSTEVGGGIRVDNLVIAKEVDANYQVVTCGEGVLFADGFCGHWSPGGYEYLVNDDYSYKDSLMYNELFDGVVFSTQIAEENPLAHDQVLDLKWGESTKDNGYFSIRNYFIDTRDMSDFAHGKLSFDIKVLDAGDSAGRFYLTVDCGILCSNNFHYYQVDNLNQWTNVAIDTDDLVDEGLDLSQVITGFSFTAGWYHQANVHVQLDNIQFKKAEESPIYSTCFAQHFAAQNIPFTQEILDASNLATLDATVNASNYVAVGINDWGSPEHILGVKFAANEQFRSCALNGTLKFQVLINSAYQTDGHLRLGVYYEDSSGKRAYLPATSSAQIPVPDWQWVSVSLSGTAGATSPFETQDADFNSEDIAYWGFYLDADGIDTSVTGYVDFDNLVIKQSL